MKIDYEKLREDLTDFYENDIPNDPEAVIKFLRVSLINNDELITIAQKENIDLNKYTIEKSHRGKK